MAGKTLFQKIWDNHVVVARDDGKTLLYVDRQLLPDWQHRAFDALVDREFSILDLDKGGTIDVSEFHSCFGRYYRAYLSSSHLKMRQFKAK